MVKDKTLIIWLKNGNTCKFERVENFQDDQGDYLFFKYFGVSTQVEGNAIFLKENIAGYALEE